MAHDPDDPSTNGPGFTRRGFIATLGTGAVAAAAAGGAAASDAPSGDAESAPRMVAVALTINGRAHRLLVEPRWSLLYVLREQLGLTATKLGCERGECGVCTVLLDGVTAYSCMILATEAEGKQVTTLEGLMHGEELGVVQRAFVEEDAYQCGYCTPGQVMAAEGLLRSNPSPNLDQIRQGMAGNICRCGAYAHIFKAVATAADLKRQGR